jgi:Ran GTPase-activating protein (RanGAP) involved in mRNA processing and transport
MKYLTFLQVIVISWCCATIGYSYAWGSLFGTSAKKEALIDTALEVDASASSTPRMKQVTGSNLFSSNRLDDHYSGNEPVVPKLKNENEVYQDGILKAEVNANGNINLLQAQGKEGSQETVNQPIKEHPSHEFQPENRSAHLSAKKAMCKLEDIGLMLTAKWQPPQIFYDCRSIVIDWEELSDNSLSHLAAKIKNHKYLQKISFVGAKHVTASGCLEIVSGIASNDKIQNFSFTNSNLNDDCIEKFGRILLASGSKRISHLDFSENSITSSGAIMLAEHISQKLPGLKSLKLSYNRISKPGGAALGKSIGDHPTLGVIKLDNNMLGDDVVENMKLSMQRNSKLHHIDLSEINLQADAGLHLSSILRTNTDIEIIDLSGNVRFSPTGAKYLAEGLAEAKSLRELRMRYCDVGDDGAIAIVSALMKLDKIELLDLTWNNIGNEGAKQVAQLLRINRSLKRVVLKRNGIGTVGFQALGDALKSNFVLQLLDLEYNQAHHDDRIQTYMARNRMRR